MHVGNGDTTVQGILESEAFLYVIESRNISDLH
jgi:hypothetical protein